MAIQIERISDTSSFEALRPAWTSLFDRARDASIFQSFEWQYRWWRHYGGGQPLCVVTARVNGELAGLLPLYLQSQRVFRFVPLKILRPVGTGGDTSPDYLGPLLAPGHEEAVAAALAHFVAGETGAWDMLRATDLDPQSLFTAALREACAKRGFLTRTGVSARIAYAPLPATFEDYLNNASRDRRYTIRNTRRKFEALPGARFFAWEDPTTLDRAIDRLIALHNLRWDEKQEEHAFSSERYNAFHRELMHECMAKGWLRLYCMEAEGEIIAMYYCYRFRDAIYYFQGGFDPARSKLRPGLVLMGYAMEHATKEGNRVFDMLRGEYEYKTQWAKERRETCYVEALRPGLPVWLHRFRHERLPAIKAKLIRRREPAASVRVEN